MNPPTKRKRGRPQTGRKLLRVRVKPRTEERLRQEVSERGARHIGEVLEEDYR